MCSDSLAQSLRQFLSSDRYVLTQLKSAGSLPHITEHQPSTFDCLIVQDDPVILMVMQQLYAQGELFPVVILKTDTNAHNFFEHPASVEIDFANLSQISYAIEQAIAEFIDLPLATTDLQEQDLLRQQQQLTENFPDESCYIVGVHKRENQYFYQQMSPAKQQTFWQQMKLDYSQILLNYFTDDTTLKQKIDNFINTAFCHNIPVPQIIELHMELIDEFSKQLKLEGRSDEMHRRSG